MDFVEIGHAKDDNSKPIINYSIAYDCNNKEPLFYEMYPGSIVDVSQLQYMLEKIAGLGYKRMSFILEREYFSETNIGYMDRNKYEFVIMIKGMKKLVLQQNGKFEELRTCSIRDYKVSGTTIVDKLFPTDEKNRYFHVYFNESKRSAEREQLESNLDQMASYLGEKEGTENFECPSSMCNYFEPIYHTEEEKKVFVCSRERTDVIDEEIKLCGYFVLITSEEMTAKAALELYKSRDASEKLFRGDKTYLGSRSFRVHSNESVSSKIFIEFVALIIRNKYYTLLKDQMKRNEKRVII